MSIIDSLTSATPEVAQMSQRLFQLNASPACVSLEIILRSTESADSLALVVVRSAIPHNSAMRVDPSHDCSFVFFQERCTSTSMLVRTARSMCSLMHHERVQHEQREHYKNAGRSLIEMRRCCRIVSSAQLWLFHNRATGDPLLPCCERQFHEPDEAPPTSIDDALGVYPTLEQPNNARTRPEADRLSHSARICCAELEGLEKQLETTIPLVGINQCANCENRRAGGTGDARVPRGPFTLCTECLKACSVRVQNILSHARKAGVRCTRRQSCNCIYRHYSERCGAVIELDGVARPNDTTYEQLADSIYDERSPIIAHTLEQFPDTMRPLIDNARIGKLARQEPPQHLAGFGLTLDYDTMLARARDVYVLPDARSLCEIALLNKTHKPLFGDKKSLDDALTWLPRCIHHVVRKTTADEITKQVEASLKPGQLLLSIELDRLVYDEMRVSTNRLMAMSRIVCMVLETPTTLHQYYGMVLRVAAFVALLDVCIVTAQKISERNLAAFVAETEQRATTTTSGVKKRQRSVPQRQQKAPRSPERKKQSIAASIHAARRLLSHAREPPPPPLPEEPAPKQRLVVGSKEFVPMTPNAHEQRSMWLTTPPIEPWPTDDEEEQDVAEAAAMMTQIASDARCQFLLGKSLWNAIEENNKDLVV